MTISTLHSHKPSRLVFRATALVLITSFIVITSLLASSAKASTVSLTRDNIIHHQSLQSKYTYFKKNNTVVIKAILLTRCNPSGFSFNWREGAEIWVSQTKKFVQGGLSLYPTIAYRKATSIKGAFVLTPAGESKLWWTKKWGCPVNGQWNTYGTKVSMTTQQLIDAGY
jgi:hypothetical protein